MKRIILPLVMFSLAWVALLTVVLWRGLHIQVGSPTGPLDKNRVVLIHLKEITNLCGAALPLLEEKQIPSYKNAIWTIGRSWKLRYNKGNVNLSDIEDPYERELFSIYLKLKELYSHERRNRSRLPRPHI